MKQTAFCILAVFFCGIAFAQPVSEDVAQRVAMNFVNRHSEKPASKATVQSVLRGDLHSLYQIDFDNGAWCVMPTDMRVQPILMFGTSERDKEDVPSAFMDVLAWYQDEIDAIVSMDSGELQSHPQWHSLLNSPKSPVTHEMGYGLLDRVRGEELKWGQSWNNDGECAPSYNQSCPEDEWYVWGTCDCGHRKAGCGAVAMGQVMWYWQWPRSSRYRENYRWECMPGSLHSNTTPSDEAKEVANLLYDCGRACDMTYSCDFSYAYSEDILDAFNNTFGYCSAIKHYASDWEYEDAWSDLIKSEIDNGRPVLFYGDNGTFFGGHFFVVDGYKEDGERLFHVNWGHRGNNNTYCKLDRFKKGAKIFYRNNRAIVGISPTYNESQIIGLNYTEVPTYHHRQEFAYDKVSIPENGSSLIVRNQGHITIEAGNEIELLPGFEAEWGSEVDLSINPVWQSQMAISVPYWPTFVNTDGYWLHVINADSWEFSLMNRHYATVFQSAGSVRTDEAYLWNGQGLPADTYLAIVTFKNSYGRILHHEYSLTVTNRRSSDTMDRLDDQEESVDPTLMSKGSVTIPQGDTSIVIWPNPSNGVFELALDTDTIGDLEVYNMQGYLCYVDNNIGASRYLLNMTAFANGQYMVVVRSRDKVYSGKLLKH